MYLGGKQGIWSFKISIHITKWSLPIELKSSEYEASMRGDRSMVKTIPMLIFVFPNAYLCVLPCSSRHIYSENPCFPMLNELGLGRWLQFWQKLKTQHWGHVADQPIAFFSLPFEGCCQYFVSWNYMIHVLIIWFLVLVNVKCHFVKIILVKGVFITL